MFCKNEQTKTLLDMKSKKIIVPFISMVLIFISNVAFSQWQEGQLNANISLPQIALVDIEPSVNNSIHFTITPATESGDPAVAETTAGGNLWINYSSSLTSAQNSRSIIAEISQGTFPEGMILYIEASGYSGTGRGQFGQSAGKVEITNQPTQIITNIGNCFTGDGINNGHLITFSIAISDYSKIVSSDELNFMVLYTITDS